MKQNDRGLAQEVQWVDLSGQKMLLEASHGGELLVEVEHGAVTIRATNCLLTEFGSPGIRPNVRKQVKCLHITLLLHNCRIDWKL
jgi:hypothetical protein